MDTPKKGIVEKALEALEQPLCNWCLGRVFGMALHAENDARGAALRMSAAMALDAGHPHDDVDFSNFAGVEFHILQEKKAKVKECSVCHGAFEKREKLASEALEKAKGTEWKTFLVSTRLDRAMWEDEKAFLERIRCPHTEVIKTALNRAVGKVIEARTQKPADRKHADIVFLLDFPRKRVVPQITPLFIYGEYQKLARDIPQTTWQRKNYATSVEQIIYKPMLPAAKGEKAFLHGAGREDVDVRCLGWRPFVLEITEPKKRSLDLKKMEKKIKGKVRVRRLRFTDMEEVRALKKSDHDKTYRCIVECEGKIRKSDLKKLKGLVGEIEQRTPNRVKYRRADKVRTRTLYSLKTKWVSPTRFEATVKTGPGLYIKELVGGDEGRTPRSFTSTLGTPCACKELDVMAIHAHRAKA